MSNIKKFRLALLLAAFVLGSFLNLLAQETKETPSPRAIPGVNAPDQFPKGCVSCHKNYPDMKFDARLSTIMSAWNDAVDPKILAKAQAMAPEGVTLKGKHTFKFSAETNIPEACNKCHGKMKSAPPLHQLLHVIHLTGDKDNHFMTMFQGECSHCHKLDQKTGIWNVVSAKEGE